jgi:hypothetical protein
LHRHSHAAASSSCRTPYARRVGWKGCDRLGASTAGQSGGGRSWRGRSVPVCASEAQAEHWRGHSGPACATRVCRSAEGSTEARKIASFAMWHPPCWVSSSLSLMLNEFTDLYTPALLAVVVVACGDAKRDENQDTSVPNSAVGGNSSSTTTQGSGRGRTGRTKTRCGRRPWRRDEAQSSSPRISFRRAFVNLATMTETGKDVLATFVAHRMIHVHKFPLFFGGRPEIDRVFSHRPSAVLACAPATGVPRARSGDPRRCP